MFTLHVGAELQGKKDNLEILFPTRPSLNELFHRIHAVFQAELGGAPLSIEQLRVYDEVLGRWVDLVKEDQLHAFAQLYAFQPDVNGQQDLRGLIPAPRRSTAGMAGAPAGYPMGASEAQKEQDRHRAIAQHLHHQLAGGGSPVVHQPMHGAAPGTPRAQYPGPGVLGSPVMNSPSQHSPLQGGYGGPFRPGGGAPPPAGAGAGGLPGVNPMQAEIDAQREQERHRLIAQHLNQQLSGEQPHGTWAQTPPHGGHAGHAHTPVGVNHHPAPSPIHPSPAAFMPSPAHHGFPASPVVHNPHNSPATPMVGRTDLPGLDPNQNHADQAQEAERHRLISEHLQRQLGTGGGGSGVTSPLTPLQHVPTAAQYSYPPAPPPQVGGMPAPGGAPAGAGGLPGVDPRQAEIDAQREQERHRLIAQHLNQQLGQGGQGAPGAGGALSPSGPPGYGAPPAPVYPTSPPAGMHGAHGMPGAGGAFSPSGPPMGGGPSYGASPLPLGNPSEADKEAERHRLIAQHLHNNLATRQ